MAKAKPATSAKASGYSMTTNAVFTPDHPGVRQVTTASHWATSETWEIAFAGCVCRGPIAKTIKKCRAKRSYVAPFLSESAFDDAHGVISRAARRFKSSILNRLPTLGSHALGCS